MTSKTLLTTCLLLSCLTSSAQTLSAEHFHGDLLFENTIYNTSAQSNSLYSNNNDKPWLLTERAYISKAQAIDIAKQRTSGKVLSARLVRKEQHAFYKIKMLTDQGRIKTLRINAQASNR